MASSATKDPATSDPPKDPVTNSDPPKDPTPTPPPTPVTQAQVDQLIASRVEAARQEEKQKLYRQIEAAKETDKKYKELLEKQQELTDTVEKLRKAAENPPENKKKDGGLSQADIEAAIKRATTEARKQSEDQINELKEQQAKLEKAAEEARMEAFKQRRITEVMAAAEESGEGHLIPELVNGSTEAEINESIVRSQQIYARTVSQGGGSGLPATQGNAAAPPSAAGKGGANATPPGTLGLEEQQEAFRQKIENLKRTNPAKLREPEILEEMQRLFPSGS